MTSKYTSLKIYSLANGFDCLLAGGEGGTESLGCMLSKSARTRERSLRFAGVMFCAIWTIASIATSGLPCIRLQEKRQINLLTLYSKQTRVVFFLMFTRRRNRVNS